MDQIFAKTITRVPRVTTITDADYEEVARIWYPTPCQMLVHVAVGQIVASVKVYLIVRCGNGLTSWEERIVVNAWNARQRIHSASYVCASLAVQVALQSEVPELAEVTVSVGPLVAR